MANLALSATAVRFDSNRDSTTASSRTQLATAFLLISSIISSFSSFSSFSAFANAQTLSFMPSVNLNSHAVAFSQSTLIGDERVLFGGIDNIKNGSSISTDDPASYFSLNASLGSVGISSNPAADVDIEWSPFDFDLPMALSGSFSTQYDNTLYITPMGTQMGWGTGCDDCVWYADLGAASLREEGNSQQFRNVNADGIDAAPPSKKKRDGSSDDNVKGMGYGIQWIQIPFNASLRARRRAGLSASKNKLRLFGGVGEGSDDAIREVLTYCLIEKRWYVEATFSPSCPEAAQLSSCAVFYISDEEYMLGCVASNMWSILVATWYPAVNDTLSTANIYPLDRPLVGGMSIARIGQFLVGFGQRIGKSGTFNGDCSPYILTVDMSTGMASPLAADDVACRFGVTVFSNGPAIVLAGGISPTTKQLTGTVETASFGPSISYATRSGARSYAVGDTISILTQPCGPGTILRMANSPTCQSPIYGTHDTACTPSNANDYSTGSVSFVATKPIESAYLCVAFGSCQIPQANRTQCPFATSTSDFYTCTHSGCCYDASSTYEGFDRCYAYAPVVEGFVQDGVTNTTPGTNYFMLVAPTVPFTVNAATNAPSFIETRNGIIIVSSAAGGALFLMLLTLLALVRYRRLQAKARDEDGSCVGDNVEAASGGGCGPADDDGRGEYYGKYKILKKLGQGGFGSVFLVERITDRKQLALKHIICKDEEERNYAITEFEILYAAQGHENMISLEEMIITWENKNVNTSNADPSLNNNNAPIRSFTDKRSSGSGGSGGKKKGELAPLLLQVAPKAVCIVMDYCPDGDLSAYVNKVHQLTGRSLPEHLLLRVVADQVCSLLIHLQSRSPPICHRDLKPENILLKDNATKVLVTDFGLAQSLEKSFMSTRAGTLHYMAPECWKRHYTATVDMWALGCILYACATVRVAPEARRVMFHDAKKPNFAREIAFDLRDYSDLFRTIVLGLLVVDPAKRLTAEKVIELLNEN